MAKTVLFSANTFYPSTTDESRLWACFHFLSSSILTPHSHPHHTGASNHGRRRQGS